jgi:hypothetical protein
LNLSSLTRWLGPLLRAAPGIVVVVFLGPPDQDIAAVLLTLTLWTSLTTVAAGTQGWGRWLARPFLVLLAGTTLGTQTYFYERYHAFLTPQDVVVRQSLWPSVSPQLPADRLRLLRAFLVPMTLAALWPLLCARVRPTGRRAALAAVDFAAASIGLGMFVVPWHSPDGLTLACIGKLAQMSWQDQRVLSPPGSRSPLALPLLIAHPNVPRNVLFVLTEASTTAVVGPARRLVLRRLRVLSANRAISQAILWSGLAIDASQRDFQTAPLVWEYAHAAGLATGYFTSRSLLSEYDERWLDGVPLTRTVNGSELGAQHTNPDAELVEVTLGHIASLAEPFFAVVHLSSDDGGSSVERLVSGLGSVGSGERTVVLFLSQNVPRAPFWIDAPADTLGIDEEAHLRSLEEIAVTELDLLPTLLDLMGLWDASGLAPFRSKMPGQSLLRGGSWSRPARHADCNAFFPCDSLRSGAFHANRNYVTTNDEHFCLDADTDRPMDPSACTDLRGFVERSNR